MKQSILVKPIAVLMAVIMAAGLLLTAGVPTAGASEADRLIVHVNDENGRPLSGAKIEVFDPLYSVFLLKETQDGTYTINYEISGKCIVGITCKGYEKLSQDVRVSGETHVTVQLKPQLSIGAASPAETIRKLENAMNTLEPEIAQSCFEEEITRYPTDLIYPRNMCIGNYDWLMLLESFGGMGSIMMTFMGTPSIAFEILDIRYTEEGTGALVTAHIQLDLMGSQSETDMLIPMILSGSQWLISSRDAALWRATLDAEAEE